MRNPVIPCQKAANRAVIKSPPGMIEDAGNRAPFSSFRPQTVPLPSISLTVPMRQITKE